MSAAFTHATPKDAGVLVAILRGWIQETPWMPKLHSPAEDLGFLGHLIATQEVSVAHLKGAAAGFMARLGPEISCLYLAPQARGQGLGAQLLDRAKAQSPRLCLWTFQANIGARRFYARHGFVETERTDGARNDERLPDARLIWERTAP